MFEVKILVHIGSVGHTITVATFSGPSRLARDPRVAAIKFAKLLDAAYEVDVVNVADEDNAENAFGLVYHRDATF